MTPQAGDTPNTPDTPNPGMQEPPVWAVEVDDLWRIYKMGNQEVPALRGLNLRIGSGRFIAVKGRSGSGKTTLLNCLGGLDHPSSGAVRIFGVDLATLGDQSLTHWRSRQLGLIFQSFGLIATLSAYENVELMLRLAGVRGRKRHNRAVDCLRLVGLQRWMHHRPYELSGGQQQRVAIARAIANRPRLILADEPTGELDSTTAREILSLFRNIVNHEKVTLVMASHDPIVDGYVDQVFRLKDGQIES